MIELENVSLAFPDGDGRVTALDAVSLTARPGTVTAVTGPSGSGKSSLLAVAGTLLRPDSGSVRIDGEEVSGYGPRESARLRSRRLGIVFQQSNLLPALTARDQLLAMPALTGGRAARARAAERADELLDEVGLAEHAGKRPHQLSGGQRQRVNVARALMHDPRALLVDEPTSALDQERGGAVIDLLLRLSARWRTATLLVTHDLAHLARMHAHVAMLDGVLTPGVAPGEDA